MTVPNRKKHSAPARVKWRDGFPYMPAIVPKGKRGEAEISYYEISEFDAMRDRMRGVPTEAETIACLHVRNSIMMSDSYNERLTNRSVVVHATGDVLIAGLGIGMVTHAIAAKPDVMSIVVIENNPDVAALVEPTVPAKARVVAGDAFTWTPAKGVKFDTIYFDIWRDIPGTDEWQEMKRLKARAKRWLKPGGWMGCWMESTAKRGGLTRRGY